jgi:PDZ domain-containing protein/TIR domain-containing protein
MPGIFISYRRDDASWPADRLYQALSTFVDDPADSLFIDIEKVPFGVDFVKHIAEQVARCDVMLVLIGPSWLSAPHSSTGGRRVDDPNDYVRIEIRLALKGGLRVIPILLDGARMPRAEQLPADIRALSTMNGLEIRRMSIEADIARLAQGLGLRKRGTPASSPIRAETAAPGRYVVKPSTWGRRIAWSVAVVIVVAGGAIGGWMAVREPSELRPGWVGVWARSIVPEKGPLSQSTGAFITDVARKSPAASAGLKIGDNIVAIDGDPVKDDSAFVVRVSAIRPGSEAVFTVLRHGTPITLKVGVKARPPEEGIDALYAREKTREITASTVPLRPEQFDFGRWLPLQNYPDSAVWEFGAWGSNAVAAYLRHKDGKLVPLDGRAANIHGFNAEGHLRLENEAQVNDYLRLFMAYVWNNEKQPSPFVIVDSEEEFDRLFKSARGETRAGAKFVPLTVTQSGDHYDADTTILYDKALFLATLRVSRNGKVEMLEDKPLAVEIPKNVSYVNGQRSAIGLKELPEDGWALPPMIPGEWKQFDEDSFQVARQFVISSE